MSGWPARSRSDRAQNLGGASHGMPEGACKERGRSSPGVPWERWVGPGAERDTVHYLIMHNAGKDPNLMHY